MCPENYKLRDYIGISELKLILEKLSLGNLNGGNCFPSIQIKVSIAESNFQVNYDELHVSILTAYIISMSCKHASFL